MQLPNLVQRRTPLPVVSRLLSPPQSHPTTQMQRQPLHCRNCVTRQRDTVIISSSSCENIINQHSDSLPPSLRLSQTPPSQNCSELVDIEALYNFVDNIRVVRFLVVHPTTPSRSGEATLALNCRYCEDQRSAAQFNKLKIVFLAGLLIDHINPHFFWSLRRNDGVFGVEVIQMKSRSR
jgi:hypothetical protein